MRKHLQLFIKYIGLMIILGNLIGCVSTNQMSLAANPGDDGINHQLLLLKLVTGNQYHRDYQPVVEYVNIVNVDTNNVTHYGVDKVFRSSSQEQEYLLSFALRPGNYMLRNITGHSGVYPFVGTFDIPAYERFSVGQTGVVYLGRLTAIVEKRSNDNQLRAGSIVPVIDQAVSGFSLGTFVITVDNNYQDDMADFSAAYPVLMNDTAKVAILPVWQQPTASEMQ